MYDKDDRKYLDKINSEKRRMSSGVIEEQRLSNLLDD
jgi:hypothetical protein